MRKLNGFILGCTLALFANFASAQVSIIIGDGVTSTVIPAEHITSIQVLTNTNVVSIMTKEAYIVEPVGEPCTVDCDDPTPAVITAFAPTVSTETINEGEFTTLAWMTTDAVSCSLTSSPVLAIAAVSTFSAGTNVVINTAGNYTFTLTCQGTDGVDITDTATVTVVEEEGDPQTNTVCDGYTSPLGSGIQKTWSDFWGSDFPSAVSTSIYPTVPINSYVAVEFNTGNISDNGYIENVEYTRTTGVKLVTISECPGDFDVEHWECSISWGSGASLEWSTNDKSYACDLDKNSTYFLNITFTDGEDKNSSTCDGIPCILKLRHLKY